MRSFVGIPTQAYFGNLYDLPTQTKNTKFGGQPPLPPTTIATQFIWSNYNAGTANPNIAATVNMGPQQARQLIDKILSVRIDNLGNAVPVYVYFPDTNYTVCCPPNAVVWEPVQTAQYTAFVIGEGFTDQTVGATAVYFCNFHVPPIEVNEFPQAASLWLASSAISRGGNIFNTNFGVPALGDQTIATPVGISGAGVIVNNLWGTPYSSGFLYLTHVDMSVTNISITTGLVGKTTLFLESTGSAGVLYALEYGAQSSYLGAPGGAALSNFYPPASLLRLSAMNVKLDATQLWRIRVVSIQNLTCDLLSTFNWTNNPN